MNILIPMCGLGSRFLNNGYSLPKPLINVNGEPMIKKAIQSLGLKGNYIFIILNEHVRRYPYFQTLLLSLVDNAKIIVIDSVTEGPASTCLFAKDLIDNDVPLLIANCDQIMHWDQKDFTQTCHSSLEQGIIVTYSSTDPKNSFIQFSKTNEIIAVIEKIPVSNVATVGLYFWKKGKYFVESAIKMIALAEKYNNEYYVGPAYNQLLKQPGFKVACYHVADPVLIGTPEDLQRYLSIKMLETIS